MKRHEGCWMLITMLKRLLWKGYTVYVSNSMTFCKRQNYGDQKDQSLPGVRVEGRDDQAEHRWFLGKWDYSIYYSDRLCH